jgi:hypothetical protein
MAPELALDALTSLTNGGVILDPMVGSGTVLQQAQRLGLSALGFDLDPLAVLISRVATTSVADETIEVAGRRIISEALALNSKTIELPWIDGDITTENFIEYWFGESQRAELRRIAYVLWRAEEYGISDSVANVLRVALSRIIVTKASAASLAQDTSHSRPHKVRTETDYDVFAGYAKSLKTLRKRIGKMPTLGNVRVGQGDARDLCEIADCSVDLVLTSPPYLNAIDYMRGHKMSLVWLGYGIDELTAKRSTSIGAERRPDKAFEDAKVDTILATMGDLSGLPAKFGGMIQRYAIDLQGMLVEVARVLKSRATATFVMGNSCLRGIYIQNSEGLVAAGELAGLSEIQRSVRDLPNNSRYLPTPASGTLSKRMRKEVIVTLQKP